MFRRRNSMAVLGMDNIYHDSFWSTRRSRDRYEALNALLEENPQAAKSVWEMGAYSPGLRRWMQ